MRTLHFHVGLDHTGHRHRRQRSTVEARRARERRTLQPRVMVVASGPGRAVWRNGLHRRRWLALVAQMRGDRRCFLMTLGRPPLILPILPF